MSVVAVGMSGGVDSSVAALLLKRQGHDVIGLTMRIYDGQLEALGKSAIEHSGGTVLRPMAKPAHHSCFGPGEDEEIGEARSAADKIGIPHRVIDLRKEYEAVVLDYFSAEYSSGRTPNPCVLCNAEMKFGLLVQRAFAAGLGFDYFATGHYVRSERDSATGLVRLLRAVDEAKDQSYFLYRLTQEHLSRAVFPLGNLRKTEVREIAREAGLVSEATRPESQNFTTGDYASLIKGARGPGDFVDEGGKVLGRHRGLPYYTIGQRRGLGLSISSEPLYVVGIDPKTNQVRVGREERIYGKRLTAAKLSWTSIPPITGPEPMNAKIRSQAKRAAAIVEPAGEGRISVTFSEPQLAITPGQSVVLYQGETVAGGGIIEGA